MIERRIDPDPFTIIAAVTGVIGAAIGSVALWRDMSRPLPSKVRRKLLRIVDTVDDHLRYLDVDIGEIEKLFERAEFPGGRYIRLGNGARLTPADFATYERVSSQVFSRLDKLHRAVLRLEKITLLVPYIEDNVSAKYVGQFTVRLERLLQTRDLSVEESWLTLHEAIADIRNLCLEIHKLLS